MKWHLEKGEKSKRLDKEESQGRSTRKSEQTLSLPGDELSLGGWMQGHLHSSSIAAVLCFSAHSAHILFYFYFIAHTHTHTDVSVLV